MGGNLVSGDADDIEAAKNLFFNDTVSVSNLMKSYEACSDFNPKSFVCFYWERTHTHINWSAKLTRDTFFKCDEFDGFWLDAPCFEKFSYLTPSGEVGLLGLDQPCQCDSNPKSCVAFLREGDGVGLAPCNVNLKIVCVREKCETLILAHNGGCSVLHCWYVIDDLTGLT